MRYSTFSLGEAGIVEPSPSGCGEFARHGGEAASGDLEGGGRDEAGEPGGDQP